MRSEPSSREYRASGQSLPPRASAGVITPSSASDEPMTSNAGEAEGRGPPNALI